MAPTPEEALADVVGRVFPGRPFTFEPLAGGITNANFKVRLGTHDPVEAEDVVVRIPGKGTHLLGIDRRAEAAANQVAALAGVAPELVGIDPVTGGIVTRYIEGRAVPMEELANEPMLGDVVATLGRVHRAGMVDASFDPFSVIRSYHDLAGRQGATEPFDYREAESLLSLVESVRPFQPSVLGHNDLLNSNLLHDGSLRILDWEYAGMADPFFDLANLSVNNELGHERDESLLSHYLGAPDDATLAMLRLMKLVSELREAMWGVVQIAISELEIDLAAYARERGERLARLVDELDPGRLAHQASLVRDQDRTLVFPGSKSGSSATRAGIWRPKIPTSTGRPGSASEAGR